MHTSIRIARDGFLAAVLAGTAAFLFGRRFVSDPVLTAWLAGAVSVLAGIGTAAWLVHRRVARPLDALTRGFMTSPPRIPAPGFGDIDEMHDLSAALERLLSSIHKRMNASKDESDRLAQIIETLPIGLLELDERGRIVFQNRMLRDLLGTSEGSIGRPPVEAIRSGELQELVDAVRDDRAPRSADVTLVKPVRRHLTVHARPLEHGFMVIVEDMTRIRQLERARSEMVANISHELRTPLAAILGYLETLDQGPDLSAEDRARFLSVITRNSKRLERLVQDLSRLARLESKHEPPALELLDLSPIVGGVLETLAPRALASGIEIRNELASTLPEIRADRDGLETVLFNLLDNALRATPAGGTITVGGQPEDAEVRLWVEDTGPGIPAELRERVFERLYRVDAGRAAREGGTGLGLAIVKHTLLQYGGRVWIEEGGTGGTRVVLLLPVASSQAIRQ